MITVRQKQLLNDKSLNESFDQFETFDQYWKRITELRGLGKTTGANQSIEMIQYSEMSYVRTNRILKHAQLSQQLIDAVNNTTAFNWLIITEAWCGDASNTVPLMIKAAQLNPRIDVRIMVRDEHPTIMDNYLTHGAKSIPILVLFNTHFDEVYRWGPRPSPCQELFLSLKNSTEYSKEEKLHKVQEWYVKDKGQTFQNELSAVLNNLNGL
jgi:hypothetical protein